MRCAQYNYGSWFSEALTFTWAIFLSAFGESNLLYDVELDNASKTGAVMIVSKHPSEQIPI